MSLGSVYLSLLSVSSENMLLVKAVCTAVFCMWWDVRVIDCPKYIPDAHRQCHSPGNRVRFCTESSNWSQVFAYVLGNSSVGVDNTCACFELFGCICALTCVRGNNEWGVLFKVCLDYTSLIVTHICVFRQVPHCMCVRSKNHSVSFSLIVLMWVWHPVVRVIVTHLSIASYFNTTVLSNTRSTDQCLKNCTERFLESSNFLLTRFSQKGQ